MKKGGRRGEKMSELQPADGATLPSYGWDRTGGGRLLPPYRIPSRNTHANFGIGGPLNCTRGGKVLGIGWTLGLCSMYPQMALAGSGVAPSISEVPVLEYRLVQE